MTVFQNFDEACNQLNGGMEQPKSPLVIPLYPYEIANNLALGFRHLEPHLATAFRVNDLKVVFEEAYGPGAKHRLFVYSEFFSVEAQGQLGMFLRKISTCKLGPNLDSANLEKLFESKIFFLISKNNNNVCVFFLQCRCRMYSG